MQFFLFEFQLQHNGVKLHVQIVGSLQFPFIVLPDVQGVPRDKTKTVTFFTSVIVVCVPTLRLFEPELLSASLDQLLVQPVKTRALGFDLLKVVPHFVPPFHLERCVITAIRKQLLGLT